MPILEISFTNCYLNVLESVDVDASSVLDAYMKFHGYLKIYFEKHGVEFTDDFEDMESIILSFGHKCDIHARYEDSENHIGKEIYMEYVCKCLHRTHVYHNFGKTLQITDTDETMVSFSCNEYVRNTECGGQLGYNLQYAVIMINGIIAVKDIITYILNSGKIRDFTVHHENVPFEIIKFE